MKAKHFKKLRNQCKYYHVDESTMLFGHFNWDWKQSIKVFARSHFEAIKRARFKGYAKRKSQPSSINVPFGLMSKLQKKQLSLQIRFLLLNLFFKPKNKRRC